MHDIIVHIAADASIKFHVDIQYLRITIVQNIDIMRLLFHDDIFGRQLTRGRRSGVHVPRPPRS